MSVLLDIPRWVRRMTGVAVELATAGFRDL